MIDLPIANREYRLFYFTRADGRGQLNADETIQSATITATDIATGESIEGLVSEVAPYVGTAVRYFLDPGAAELEIRAKVFLQIVVTTSTGQTLTDWLIVQIVP